MKVAITGASGYLGGHIAEAFRKQGHEVLCLSRRPCGDSNWIRYSLDDDPLRLPWSGVDALIHAAYDFEPRRWPEILARNVKPSVSLFQAAIRSNVGKLIFISSMSSFEGCRSDYGKAKRMIENEVLNLGAWVVRPGLVWGDPSGGVMGSLEKAVAMLPVIPFPSGGMNSRQFLIHHNDLSDALVSLSENQRPAHRAVQTLADPTPLSLHDILTTIAQRANRRRIYFPVPWPCAMAGLKTAEMLHVPIPFRSDSLSGLIHGNTNPEIDAPPAAVRFRPFE